MVVAIGPGKGARGVAPPVHQDHLGLGDVRADRQIRQGPILRHVECRRAVRGVHRYAIDYRKGGAGHRESAEVEWHGSDSFTHRIEEVPRRYVEAEDAAGEQHAPQTGPDRNDLDGGSLDGRPVRGEHDVLAVRQNLGPPVAQLAVRRVRAREHALVAPALTHDPETGVVGPGVDEPTVLAPAAAGPVGHREVDRGPAIHRDLSELPLSCGGDPPSVRRNERPAVSGPLLPLAGTGDHVRPHLVERAPQDLLPPAHHGGDEELSAVGAQPHDGREGGLHSRVELDVEPDGACRRARAPPVPQAHPSDREQQDCR